MTTPSTTIADVSAKPIVYRSVVEVVLDQSDAAAVDLAALNDAVNEHQGAIAQAITAAAVRPGCSSDSNSTFEVSSGVACRISTDAP